jgi:hyaluronan synthase
VSRYIPASVAAVVWLLIAARLAQISTTAGVVTLAVFLLFCVRLLLAWGSRAAVGDPPQRAVSVVLPLYNEDPALLLRSLESLARQTYLPQRVWLIDDGSDDPSAADAAEAFEGPFELHVIRCEENRGKRQVQAEAFRRDTTAEVFVTADSDTVFHEDAIREGLKPFADPAVTAVAGLVRPINRTRNLLTRLQDSEYLSSFLLERASLSSLQGSVLVTSGGLALYRADVVREVLDEYVAQTFAGRPVHTGDDRMLTQLSLQRGRVVMQHTAIADTAVPERWSHLLRQRVRWSRSFWVNSLWVFGNMKTRSWAFWLVGYYLASVTALFLSLLIVGIVAPELGLRFVGIFLLMVAGLSYLRAARILAVQLPGSTPWQQLSTYLMVGPAILFNLLVLMPVRLWALIRIRDVASWGTRQQVEQITHAPAAGDDAGTTVTAEDAEADPVTDPASVTPATAVVLRPLRTDELVAGTTTTAGRRPGADRAGT